MEPIVVNLGDYPLKNIAIPHPHDVLCGRGGGTNNHVGNSHWRMLVAANKQLYVTLPKRQKMLLSRSIVNAVRSQNPPGRFLQKEPKSDLWYDVGDQRAQEKTSQALREGAPDLRSKISSVDNTDVSTSGYTGTTEFAGSVAVNLETRPESMPSTSLSLTSESIMSPPASFVPVVLPAMAAPPGGAPLMLYAMPQHGITGVPMYPAILTPQGIVMHGAMPAAFPAPVPPQGPVDQKQNSASRESTSDLMPPPQSLTSGFQRNSHHSLHSPIDEPSSGSIKKTDDNALDFEQQAAALMTLPLENGGMSFGSALAMSVPNQKLEPSGISFGSMMSYSVANSKAPEMVDGGLDKIGASMGSLSLNSTDVSNIREALLKQPPPTSFATPTLLSQQRSKGDLLECSDTDSDDDDVEDAPNHAWKSAEWEKLTAMIEQNAKPKQSHAKAFDIKPVAPVELHDQFEALPQTALFDNLSALSMGDFGDHDHVSPTSLRQTFNDSYDSGMPPPIPLPPKSAYIDDENYGLSEREQL